MLLPEPLIPIYMYNVLTRNAAETPTTCFPSAFVDVDFCCKEITKLKKYCKQN